MISVVKVTWRRRVSDESRRNMILLDALRLILDPQNTMVCSISPNNLKSYSNWSVLNLNYSIKFVKKFQRTLEKQFTKSRYS